MIPSLGRIVLYSLTADDAQKVNQRRADLHLSRDVRTIAGCQVHDGNDVSEGDVLPMMIVKFWDDTPSENTAVNGKVFLDGSDVLWVTSRSQSRGTLPNGHPYGGFWAEPPRV